MRYLAIRIWESKYSVSTESINYRSLSFFTCYVHLPQEHAHLLMSAVHWALSAHMQI